MECSDGRGDQARHLLTAQHHLQRVRDMHRLHLGHQLGMVGGDVEEELQPGDGRIERDRRDTVIDHFMQGQRARQCTRRLLAFHMRVVVAHLHQPVIGFVALLSG